MQVEPAHLLLVVAPLLVLLFIWQKREARARQAEVESVSSPAVLDTDPTVEVSFAPAARAYPAKERPLRRVSAAPSRRAADSAEAEAAGESGHMTVLYEPHAEEDEPTAPGARIRLTASGDSDRGQRRARNEDSFLAMPEHGLFVVADGMGGYAGGQVASALAVAAIKEAFEAGFDEDERDPDVPRRGRELANAVRQANQAVFKAAKSTPELRDMGTTLVSLRFAFDKQRLYVGHVGDSRCYRLRGGELKQLTSDHVMKQLGVQGPQANHLFRAVGINAQVALDLVVDKPLPDDVYLLCSDGLSKMLSDAVIRETLLAEPDPEIAVYDLIEKANDAGGRDNVTVVLAKVLERGAVSYGRAAAS